MNTYCAVCGVELTDPEEMEMSICIDCDEDDGRFDLSRKNKKHKFDDETWASSDDRRGKMGHRPRGFEKPSILNDFGGKDE